MLKAADSDHAPALMTLFYRFAPYAACLLACTLLNLFYFPRGISFPDEMRFMASAVELARSGEFWVGIDRAWEMPGTALFFAPAVKLFGSEGAILVIRFAQSSLLVLQCGLVAYLARLLFNDRCAALIAATVAAVYPFFLFYQGFLLSETLFNVLLTLSVAALYRWRERGMRIDFSLFVVCLCFAAAAWTKATLTFLPPLLLAVTAWLGGTGLRRATGVLLASVLMFGALMAPWSIRNATLLHAFVPFTTGSALNLYLGNNAHNPEGGSDWKTDSEQAVVDRITSIPGEVAKQNAWSEAAVAFIKQDPAGFVYRAGRKFLRFWSLTINAPEFSKPIYSVVSALTFGPVLALALICVVRRWRQWRLLAPIYLTVGYFTFVHAVTIASLRYRLPLEPLLIVLAAEPIGAALARRRKTAVA